MRWSWPALFVGMALAGALSGASASHAQSDPDVQGAIYAAARIHGVDPAPLIALVRCETGGTFDPETLGDYRWREGRYVPTSRGAAQLSDLPTGLAGHFWSLGYTDRGDPEQTADYIARVYQGEFLRHPPPLHPFGRVSMNRWSCWR